MNNISSPEVSFNEVRMMLFRNSGFFSDWLKPLADEEWQACWGSSVNKQGVIHTIEARAIPGEFNIIQTFPNGAKIISRMSNGEYKWDIKTENDEHKAKTFRSEKGIVITHMEIDNFIFKRRYTASLSEELISSETLTRVNKKTGEITHESFKQPPKAQSPQRTASKSGILTLLQKMEADSNTHNAPKNQSDNTPKVPPRPPTQRGV